MKTLLILPLTLMALPLSAQAWDLRLEAPFASGQDLPATQVQGTGPTSGSLDTGHGLILTVSHRIVRVGPVLKFEWNGEWSQLRAGGQIQQGAASAGSGLKQSGLGAGINAQFWLPFTGFAGELGLMERFHSYQYQAAGIDQDRTIARPWLRVGMRWVLPFPGSRPTWPPATRSPSPGTGRWLRVRPRVWAPTWVPRAPARNSSGSSPWAWASPSSPGSGLAVPAGGPLAVVDPGRSRADPDRPSGDAPTHKYLAAGRRWK